MEIPTNPSAMIDLLRAWFFAKDRSVVLANDTFIEGNEIDTPDSPVTGRRKLYAKDDCWYDLDSDGTETSLCGGDLINRWGNTITSFQALPGLVGFWPMSSVKRSTGSVYDLSEQDRTLTYNGNPTYNYYNDFIPYIDLDGTGDFLSRADETDLRILGTETIYNTNVRGLTMGCWTYAIDWTVALYAIMSKYSVVGNNRAYLIYVNGGAATAVVSTNGIATVTVTSGALVNAQWSFVVMRFVPSTTLDIYVNDVKTTQAVGVPASIFNGNAPLQLGAFQSGSLLTGRLALCFLSANALSDALINGLFQQTRILFEV